MSKVNMCPFFRKCPASYSLEKTATHLFFQHYCLGECVSRKHIKIHHDNPCVIFKGNDGQKINACVYFQECSVAAHRSVASKNLYEVACLGICNGAPKNIRCKQYQSFVQKTLHDTLPLLQKSTKNKE
jgi:hypothetical protein